MFEDGAAGRAAVKFLIEEGRLVPDFWLRSEEACPSNATTAEYELHRKEVGDAVRFALGKDVTLPEWASPLKESPDCVWISPSVRGRYYKTEPYYWAVDLASTFVKCHNDIDLDSRDGHNLERTFLNLAWRSWHRLVPYFDRRRSGTILEIEQERGHSGNTFSKKYRKDHMLSGIAFRDTALYEFYVDQGSEGLKNVFHGIGQKAILGVGAMLFLSGEHDDLLYAAERLEEVLNPA
jgi:hypothetical protein